MFPFSYKLIVYNETEKTYSLCEGMGLCNSYTQAMQYIEDYYGENIVSIKNLELYEENNLILLPPSTIEQYVKTAGFFETPCSEDGTPISTEEINKHE